MGVRRAPMGYADLTRLGQLRRLRRAAHGAMEQYAVEPMSLSLLVAHAHNTTFAVTGPDGARYALHMVRPLQRDAFVPESVHRTWMESELWWLDRVHLDLGRIVPA